MAFADFIWLTALFAKKGVQVVKLKEIVLIHDLKRQGLSVSAIARKLGCDRKTIRKYLATGLEAPVYGPRTARPRLIDPYCEYLHERIVRHPGLSGARLLRDIRDLGYKGGYSAVTAYLKDVRPAVRSPFERRFETPPGKQAQVDFAEFKVGFTDEPGVMRKVWLFSMVLGSSRWLWGQFCSNQNLHTVLRCHIAAFTAMDGVPSEVLYDRMKTAVVGDDADGTVNYNKSLVALLDHYGAIPRACKAYRAKTKGKVERPFRYIRQDFFLGRTFRNMEDLNVQFEGWRTGIANPRVHATTGLVVEQAFITEQPSLIALPPVPYSAVLTVERRVSHEGMISVAGNYYSVPDTTRKRVLEVQSHPNKICIFEEGMLIATHPVLEGKNQRRVDPLHRKAPSLRKKEQPPIGVSARSLAFYGAVGKRLATQEQSLQGQVLQGEAQ